MAKICRFDLVALSRATVLCLLTGLFLAPAASADVPVLTSFTPAAGPVGTTVTLNGRGFLGATDVVFQDGVRATPATVTATSLRVVVPAGAVTGSLAVVTPDGRGTSTSAFRVAPMILGFSPTTGILGAQITLSGFNLANAGPPPVVQVGAATAVLTDVTPTSITLTIPPTATTGRLTVKTSDGVATTVASLTVIRPPTVTSFSPASGTVGQVVTITGTGLSGVAELQFEGARAAVLAPASATSLRVTVPAGAMTGRLSVTNTGGSGQSAQLFRVAPKILGFTPTTGILGTQVTLSGFNLANAGPPPVVQVGAVPAVVTDATPTSVTLTIPPAAMTGRLTVKTSDGVATTDASLTVIRPPTVTSFSPASATVGQVVTVTGTGLGGVAEVRFEGASAPVLAPASPTSLRVTVPAGATTGRLSVTNTGGSGQSAQVLRVAPKILDFAPVTGILGTRVTLTGFNLANAGPPPVVQVGTVSAVVTDVTPTSVTMTIPPAATTGRLTVRTSDGVATTVASLTVIRPPTVTALSPASGTVGQVVTLTGTGLSGVSEVQFEGARAAVLAPATATSLRVTVPAGAVTGRLSVTNTGGSGLSASVFRLLPKITGLTPTAALVNDRVTVTGFNLTESAVPTVRVGAVGATVVTAAPTSVTFTVPAAAITGRITVMTTAAALSPTELIVIRPPTVASFSPAAGPVGTTVTVSGTNLGTATGVTFNGGGVAAVTIVSPTSLRVVVPPGATTGRIGVINPAGSAQSVGVFRAAPRITLLSPGAAVPGEAVTITGFNLTAGAALPTVRVGSVAAVVSGATPTSATLIVPATATTNRVSVTTVDGTGSSDAALTVLARTVPRPAAMQPPAAAVGATIVVTGSGLSLSNRVVFTGGIAAIPTAVTATSLSVVVPNGAATGPLTVTNPVGTGTSAATLRILPAITTVTPRAGVVGATITVSGTSLKVGSNAPQVSLGGLPVAVETSSPAAVTIRIPEGAASGRIQLTTADGTATSADTVLVTPRAVVEAALRKTTTRRTGTTLDRVVEVRFPSLVGDFHSVTVTDGVLLQDAPLVLGGQLVSGGRVTDDFRLRRVLTDTEEYPAADRQFTIVATPAAGGDPIVMHTTPQTLGSLDEVTIFDVLSARVTAEPRILTFLESQSSVVGSTGEAAGTIVEVFGCLGQDCSFTSLGTALMSPPFWAFTLPSAVHPGDRISARATAPGKITSRLTSSFIVTGPGQLVAPRIVEPVSSNTTDLLGSGSEGSTVEVFAEGPVVTSLGSATVVAGAWQIQLAEGLGSGQRLFAIARQPGFADSPPSEVVVVAEPADTGVFAFSVVEQVPLVIAWDMRGLTAPLASLRLSIIVANAEQTLACSETDVFNADVVPPGTASVTVFVPSTCTGPSGPQPAVRGEVCVGTIDDRAQHSEHCLVLD